MRVLHLIDSLGRGGAERLLVTLLPALASQGIEPLVGVLRAPYDLEADLRERNVEVVRLPRFARWNLPAAARALGGVCRTHDVALVHAHLYFPSIYAAYAALNGGVPMVETFHNLAYAGANADSWKLAMRRHLRGFLLRRGGSRFYGVSDAVAAHYADALGLADVGTAPNVIDLEAIDAAGAPSDPRSDVLRIAVPGRLVKEKGHADLLEALAAGDFPPFELVFIGGGPLEASLAEEARRRGIALEIAGPAAHSAFLRQVAAADIVAVPSRHEGFGIAAAEAMALGKPVIASRAGGLPEVVGEAGMLYPVGDVPALRAGLAELVRDADMRCRLGERARQSARARFAPETGARMLADEYRQVLRED